MEIKNLINKPLFMNDEDWYTYNEEEDKYYLTDLGLSKEAVVDSYNDYYQDNIKNLGNSW